MASDSLLAFFNRELEALRVLAGEFAERHPKIAGRLRLTKDTVDDPHVSRLLEGVAFLGARVQHRLDDEFPELTDALLSVQQTLFDFGANARRITAAGARLRAAGADLEAAADRVALGAVAAWYDVFAYRAIRSDDGDDR